MACIVPNPIVLNDAPSIARMLHKRESPKKSRQRSNHLSPFLSQMFPFRTLVLYSFVTWSRMKSGKISIIDFIHFPTTLEYFANDGEKWRMPHDARQPAAGKEDKATERPPRDALALLASVSLFSTML